MAKINFSEEEGFAKNIAEKVLDDFVYEGKTIREWAKIIMEQKPCEDAISRQEALKLFATHDGKYLYEAIRDMPSVKQVPKTGIWKEDIDNNRRWDRTRFYCSECGDWQTYGKPKFCPHCGAKMESEGI